MEDSFVFYQDSMPDWFFDMIRSGKVKLINCDYNRYDKNKAFCLVKCFWYTLRFNGGDKITLIDGRILPKSR